MYQTRQNNIWNCYHQIWGPSRVWIRTSSLQFVYQINLYHCTENRFKILGFADDHQIYQSFNSDNQINTLTIQLKQGFRNIKKWMSSYYLQLNESKTQINVCGSRSIFNKIQIGGVNMTPSTTIRFVTCIKNLGFMMDGLLNFVKQIVEVKKKGWYRTADKTCQKAWTTAYSEQKRFACQLKQGIGKEVQSNMQKFHKCDWQERRDFTRTLPPWVYLLFKQFFYYLKWFKLYIK